MRWPSSLHFSKMHGLGNDFVVVDLREASRFDWLDSPAAIVALCDRRRGIGADGVLAILPPTADGRAAGAVARLRIRNADGSEPEMCGNGLRCVARYLQRDPSIGAELRVETAAGLRLCTRLGDGEAAEIELAMGRPAWLPEELPLSLVAAGEALALCCVSMGNPHAVLFCAAAAGMAELSRQAERLGPGLERHPHFPQRTNVEFARLAGPNRVELVVWERGCGITQACGTGACATAVAACLTGRADPRQPLEVSLPGGRLAIRIAADYQQVYLRGPAVTVYDGELPTPPT